MTRLLVKLRAWTPDEIPALCALAGSDDDGWRIPLVRTFRVIVDDDRVGDVAHLLEADPRVERVILDAEMRMRDHGSRVMASDDPNISQQWHLVRHDVFRAWKLLNGRGDPNVRVGWFDLGTWHHEDVPWPQGWNSGYQVHLPDPTCLYPYWDEYHDPPAFSVHGLITMGLVVETAGSGRGGVGIAPGVTPYMTTPMSGNGYWGDGTFNGFLSTLMEACQKVSDFGCRIFSNSWGTWWPVNQSGGLDEPYRTQWITVAEIFHALYDQGILIVCSAGNNSNPLDHLEQTVSWMLPAGLDLHPETGVDVPVIVVGSIEPDDSGGQFRYYHRVQSVLAPNNEPSNYGVLIDITAAGYQIHAADVPIYGDGAGTLLSPSTNYGGGILARDMGPFPIEWNPTPSDYSKDDDVHCGTSFAAPMVTGGAALVLSANPSLTPAQIRAILLDTTDAGRFESTPYTTTTLSYPGPFGQRVPAFREIYPNAGVLNIGKAVSKALTTVPANAGNRYPYFNAWGASGVHNDGVVTTFSGGVATTTLDGSIKAEVGGYSSDAITGVELWLGTDKLYDGPPTILNLTASSTGTALPVKVVAKTAGGSTEETYTDIVVASLEIETVQDLPLSFSNVLAFDASRLDRPSLLTRNLSLGRDARLYGGLAAILADSTFGISTSFQPSATAQHVGSTAFHSVLGMTLDAAQSIVGANVTLGAAILLAADAVSAQVGQSVYAQIIASSQDASYAPPGVSTGDVTVPHFLNMTLDAIQREVGNVTLGEALAVGMDADYEPVGHAHAREITLCGFYADAAFFHRIPLPGHGHYTPGRGGRQYSRQRGGADYTQRGDEKGYGEGE